MVMNSGWHLDTRRASGNILKNNLPVIVEEHIMDIVQTGILAPLPRLARY
jgi:hypothetical protein